MNVPYLRPSEIDEMVFDLIRKYQSWKGETLAAPINIDEIVEIYFKIDLEFCDLRSLLGIPDVLGATWFDDKVIRIDSSLEGKEGRLSFTLAHEVGHWWMHRPYYIMERVSVPLYAYEADKEPTPAIVCRTNTKKEPAEWQADQFAAKLLMPEHLVRNAVSTISSDGQIPIHGLEQNKKTIISNQQLRQIAKTLVVSFGFSNVSIEAMCYRLTDLNLVKDSNSKQAALL